MRIQINEKTSVENDDTFRPESLGKEMNAVLDGPFRPERISFYLARDFNNVLGKNSTLKMFNATSESLNSINISV